MTSTPNLDIIAVFRNLCAKFRFSILSRCDVIDADVKGGNYMPPPCGRWVVRRLSSRPAGLMLVVLADNMNKELGNVLCGELLCVLQEMNYRNHEILVTFIINIYCHSFRLPSRSRILWRIFRSRRVLCGHSREYSPGVAELQLMTGRWTPHTKRLAPPHTHTHPTSVKKRPVLVLGASVDAGGRTAVTVLVVPRTPVSTAPSPVLVLVLPL